MPVPNALRRVLLAGVATLLLAAASPAAFAAGVLKIAHEQDVTTFDPILTIQNADIWVMDNMNAGLVRVTNDGTGLEPDLAESWTVSPDAKTYTFKLRDGLKFSDGSPLTAQDVKFSLERLRDQKDFGHGRHVQGGPEDRGTRRQDRRHHLERALRALPLDAGHVRRLGGAAEGGDREGAPSSAMIPSAPAPSS